MLQFNKTSYYLAFCFFFSLFPTSNIITASNTTSRIRRRHKLVPQRSITNKSLTQLRKNTSNNNQKSKDKGIFAIIIVIGTVFIVFIGIQNNIPGNTQNNIPDNTQSNIPGNTQNNIPDNTQNNTQNNIPSNTQDDTPIDIQRDMIKEIPKDLPEKSFAEKLVPEKMDPYGKFKCFLLTSDGIVFSPFLKGLSENSLDELDKKKSDLATFLKKRKETTSQKCTICLADKGLEMVHPCRQGYLAENTHPVCLTCLSRHISRTGGFNTKCPTCKHKYNTDFGNVIPPLRNDSFITQKLLNKREELEKEQQKELEEEKKKLEAEKNNLEEKEWKKKWGEWEKKQQKWEEKRKERELDKWEKEEEEWKKESKKWKEDNNNFTYNDQYDSEWEETFEELRKRKEELNEKEKQISTHKMNFNSNIYNQ